MLLLTAATSHASERRPLRIAASANVRSAFIEIVRQFEREHPGIIVDVVFGASGSFHAQITNGAPFDLFYSADAKYPESLAAAGLTSGAPFDYAMGRIVLWSRNGSGTDVGRGLDVLLSAGVKKIAIANPKLAPYGSAAVDALRRRRLFSRVEPKLVYAENVVQAAQFGQSGAADAAIIALSLAYAERMRTEGRFWPVPAEWHAPIRQSAVALKGAPDEARLFSDFVRSDAGCEILRRFGYSVPEGR